MYPYLLKNMEIIRPDQVWCSDITYIRLATGLVYLTAIMNWFSRRVLSWKVSTTMDTEFCVNSLKRTLRLHDKPDIFNTDQGSQYTSETFTKTLHDQGIQISMDGKGRWADNVFVERLWRTVKYEEVYIREYESVADLTASLRRYFYWYNHERTHSSLANLTPVEVHQNPSSLPLAA